jgi:hypothetical protein
MTTWSSVSRNWRGVLSPAVIGATMALAACGGGGVTQSSEPDDGGGGPSVNATPYVLFASGYERYATQTNGAYLHTVQGGDIYAVTVGNWGWGCYDSDQATINGTQLYTWQGQANAQANCAQPPGGTLPPVTAGDLFLLAIKSPGSPGGSAPVPLDISQSGSLLIQMGNSRAPSDGPFPATGGHANKFTVRLTNDLSLAGDNSQATAVCEYVQTLDGTGTGTSNYQPAGEFSAQGTRNYLIPLSSLTCAGDGLKGDVDTLKSTGVTSIAVLVIGDQNTDVLPGEFDSIVIGTIGFTK